MKKQYLPIVIAIFALISNFSFAQKKATQTWVEMMQDPTVNFYDVQKEFNKKNHKREKEMQHERYEAFEKQQKLIRKNGGVLPPKSKEETLSHGEGEEGEEEGEIPGWEVYKRWEDFVEPRVYPTGDRSVMVKAMAEYYESFYGQQQQRSMSTPTGTGTSAPDRAASGGAPPTTAAANWTIVGPTTSIPTGGGAGRVNFVRFDPSNTNILWVGSPDGGLWNSTNAGSTWTTNTDNLAVIGCSDLAIHPTNNQIMYLATGDADASDSYSIGILKTTNGGTTWNTSGLTWAVTNFRNISRLLINPQNPNTIFAATSNGVYRSRSAGAAWTQIATAVANIKDIEFRPNDTTTIYAASTTRFYKSTDGGTTFTNITSGLPATTVIDRLAIAVTAANNNYVYVVASLLSNDGFQGLYRSTDAGTTFTTRSTTPNILGWSNAGSDTGGQGWYDLAIAASPTNQDLIVVGGVNIWKSTNGGTSWTINAHWTGSGAPYVHADCHALEFIPGSATTYYAGVDGGCFRTTNAGTSWTDISNGLQIAQPYRLGLSATNANLLVTGFQDNGTNRWSGTATWNYIQGGDGMEAIVDWSNANVQYGELYYGQINRTTTGGNLTTSIVASGGTGVNADGDWVTPYIMNPLRATTLVVGKAQAYRSRNRGGAWTALGTVSGGTGNLIALAYAPADSMYLYMAKTDKFYASTNSGTSFTDRTGTLPVGSAQISYIAVANNNPAHVWVTFSGYSAANKVWYSADAGVTWSNYTTGLPNIPANCIVYQNSSATDVLYVGTDVGVYTRDNAAGSWTAYNTGLPNVIVRELEIQYTAQKLRAATFGRGIWQSDLATPGSSPPIADFSANRTNICTGDCINFTDLSTGTPTSWSWSFTGGTPATSTVQNPTNICYNTAGTYAVTLTSTNANGSDPETKTGYIVVSGTTVLPLVEGFQGTYVPTGWALNNPDADNTWAQTATAGGFATSTQSAVMDNYSPATTIAGTIDELYTPKYNFSGVSTASMTFDVAYARYSAAFTDSLIVAVSTNCGVSWTNVYNKGGFTGLQTAPDNGTSAFVPTAAQWRTETVSMTPYAGQANVSVRFTNRSGWGQMIYLDNINITGTGAPVAGVSIALTTGTNPACSGQSLTFTATPTNGGTTPVYQWQVNGANVGTNSPTYTTSTLTNGQIVTCIMTSNLSGVTGSPATSNAITMTINPTPATPTAGSNTPVCTGNTINLTSNTVAGATYAWTGPSAFTSALEDPTRTGATAAMAGTYSLTVTVGGCTSAIATTAVVVNTTPATPTATSNSPVCTGGTISLSTPTVAGATYAWTGPGAYSSTTQNPTRTGATVAMAGTYSVTVTVGGCTSAMGTTIVVVNTTPTTPTVTTNSPVCTGNSINLSTATVAGATYAWTGPSSYSSSTQNPTITGATAAMAGTYSLTVSVGGCNSPVGTGAVVVNTTPATPTPGSNSPVCTGATINLTTSTVAGATYAWTGPGAFSSALQNPTRTGATVAMAGTYSLTVTTSGCTSAVGTVAVVVNTTPATPTAGSNTPVCTGNPINLTSNTVAGATYSWTGPGGFTSSVEDPTIASATAAMAGTYSVTISMGTCTSPVGTTAVVVNTTPGPITAGNNGPICAGSTLNLTCTTAAGSTYAWSGPGGYTSAVQNPTRTGATVAMSGTYTVTATASGCSATSTTVATINASPATPTAGSNTPVCTGSTINLTTPTVAGATYAWTGPAAFTSALQNPTRTGATAGMAGTYSVTVTVGGCTSAAGTTIVAVNTTPAAPVPQANGSTTPAAICAGGTITLTSNLVAGATYAWTGPNAYTAAVRNPAALTGATVAMGGTYSLTVTVGGCTSPVATVSIAVNPIPSTPTAGSNSPVCTGNTITLTTPTVAGATYAWTGPSAFSSALQNPTRTGATAAMAGTYSVTVTVAGCTSAAGTTVVAVNSSVTPTNSIAITTGSNPTCAGSSLTFTATAGGGGATPVYQWQVNGSNVGTNSPTYTTSTLTNGQIVTCILTSSSSCASPTTATSNAITMTVNAIPSTPTAGSNSPVCSGSSINLTTPTVAGATYAWTGPSSYTSTSQNPSITGATAAMAGTYSVTVTVAGCSSVAGTTAVVVNTSVTPSVSIAASPSGAICSGTNVVFTATETNGGAAPAYQWQVNGSNAGTGATFNSSTLANGDIVTCELTSNAACATPVTVMSSGITMTVNTSVTPSVTTAITTGSNPMCAGQPITFTATALNGGVTPTYQWIVNGSNAATSSTFSPATVNDADVITCTITSSDACASPTTATSTAITMTVTPNTTPAVSIMASNTAICAGDSVVFTATPTNGGAAPAYQWTVNGSNTGTGSSYTNYGLANGDLVSCVMTTSDPCPTVLTATSNTITMTVNAVPPTPTITQLGLDFTSDAASGNQWYLDGVIIPGATGQTYTATANGTYTVIVTVAGCSSTSSAPVVIINVGIDEKGNPNLLSIYPNPNDGHFTMSFVSATKQSFRIEIMNAIGQVIFKESLQDFAGAYKKEMNIVEFGQGIYTISLTNSKNETVKKVIVY